MFLVTGHPRSGTTYTRAVFSEAGISVGGEHDALAESPSRSNDIEGVVAWPQVGLCPDRFDPIIHQVRNPVDVISSAQTLTNGAFRLMFRQTAAPRRWHTLLRPRRLFPFITRRLAAKWAMHTWLEWNRLIERQNRVIYRYKVEDIKQEWPGILELLRLDKKPFPEVVSRDTNTRKGRFSRLTTDDLFKLDTSLATAIVEQASRYGYQL